MHESKLMTSTELVEAAGTTRKALRVYQAHGLLEPVRSRGNRRYDNEALSRLRLVVALRKLGMSVDSIGILFAARDGEHVAGAAASRLASELGDIVCLAAERIRELQKIRNDLVVARETLLSCRSCEKPATACAVCAEEQSLDPVAEMLLLAQIAVPATA
jgi:DNA-binding transcriptional MerR regulator